MLKIIRHCANHLKPVALGLAAACTLMLGACTPTSITQGPLTTKPYPASARQPTNGAIYNVAAYRPLFEDRRARLIGDTLMINIAENTSATKSNASSASKTGSVNSSVTASFGSPVPRAAFNSASDIAFDDAAAANASNIFTGSIAVTVLDVLPNGYLVVGGEKQVALDKGTEFVRISGVVNPDTISASNTVPSTRVADARIEYRTNSRVDAALVTSILSRFFLSFIPL
ncbi:flagellar basal body L-ring protein FlgH [Methylovorus mays]|uniref:flagellar basal body L-ring protein FlgH n=1 Tax=Methylovorus mays TaxID=184077 RepID=UPI001E4DF0F4|nr:flagellar basal body L-ring protein FlgH [Methylovorus mays]MCB5207486.1 flagellar basal body L-ring protein FlgH [Methylovorus mays]